MAETPMIAERDGRKVTVKADVRIPTPPNFLTLDIPVVHQGTPGPPQELPKIDVADITDGGLQALGDLWTKNLIEHAQQRRKDRVGKPIPR